MPNNYLLPNTIQCQTISGRSGNKFFLTLPHCDKSKPQNERKYGQELASMIRVPEGYKLVSFDFASQEALIFGFLGDSFAGKELSCETSITSNSGDKSKGTDLHSLRATRFNISRDDAKTLGYGIQFGSSAQGLAKTLHNSNKSIPIKECERLAKTFFNSVKGTRQRGAKYWIGGTDSPAYNWLEDFATQLVPREPMLNRAISRALRPSVVGTHYALTRKNYPIQGAGASMLHYMVSHVHQFEPRAKIILTVHDYLGWMVKEEYVDNAVWAIKLAHRNAWLHLLGNLNLNYEAYNQKIFDVEVEVDICFRKSAKHPTTTPTSILPQVPDGTVR